MEIVCCRPWMKGIIDSVGKYENGKKKTETMVPTH